MTCEQARMSLGVYVLGALDPAERAAVDAHLGGCAGCREELAALAGLPGLLGRLNLADVTTVTPPDITHQPAGEPSPELLDQLLGRAAAVRAGERAGRAAHSRRRWLGVAASVALLAAAVTGVALDSTSGARLAPAATSTARATRVVLSASVHARAWGTAIDVRLSGAAPGAHCRLIAVARNGHQEVAATWQVTYEGRADFTGTTAIAAKNLTWIRVLDDSGHLLASLPVRA